MSSKKTTPPTRHVCILVSKKDNAVFYIPYREINFKPAQLLRLRLVPQTHDVTLEAAKCILLAKLSEFKLRRGFQGFVPLDACHVEDPQLRRRSVSKPMVKFQPVVAVIDGHTLRGQGYLSQIKELSKERPYLRDVQLCSQTLLEQVALVG